MVIELHAGDAWVVTCDVAQQRREKRGRAGRRVHPGEAVRCTEQPALGFGVECKWRGRHAVARDEAILKPRDHLALKLRAFFRRPAQPVVPKGRGEPRVKHGGRNKVNGSLIPHVEVHAVKADVLKACELLAKRGGRRRGVGRRDPDRAECEGGARGAERQQ